MKKLLIVLAGCLFFVGSISMSWAHGPKGSGSGYRSLGSTKPYFTRSPRSGIGHRHLGKSNIRSRRNFGRRPLSRRGVSPQSRRLPRIERGVILSKPSPLQKKFFYSPVAKSYERGFGVSPFRKSLERQRPLRIPRHSHAPRPSYFNNNPDPWFLYGKGKEFRQMGLLPPLPQTSRKLR